LPPSRAANATHFGSANCPVAYHGLKIITSLALRFPDFQRLQYVTDFAHVGRPPQVELAKELDFDFGNRYFGHVGIDYPLSEGAELFAIFQENFVSYYQSEVFAIELTN